MLKKSVVHILACWQSCFTASKATSGFNLMLCRFTSLFHKHYKNCYRTSRVHSRRTRIYEKYNFLAAGFIRIRQVLLDVLASSRAKKGFVFVLGPNFVYTFFYTFGSKILPYKLPLLLGLRDTYDIIQSVSKYRP